MLSFGTMIEFVLVIYFMTKAVSATRAGMDGWISLKEAFKPAWLTFILATTIVILFNFTLMNYLDPSLKELSKEMQVESFELASGWFKIPEADKESMIEKLEESDTFGINTIAFSLPFSFLFPGAFYAFIMALIMRREQPLSLP